MTYEELLDELLGLNDKSVVLHIMQAENAVGPVATLLGAFTSLKTLDLAKRADEAVLFQVGTGSFSLVGSEFISAGHAGELLEFVFRNLRYLIGEWDDS
jgi:hypothetical protein